MVRFDEFYEMAQKTRDTYRGEGGYLRASIVTEIVTKVFDNGDFLPEEFIISSKLGDFGIQEVLEKLKISYKEMVMLRDDCCIVKGAEYKKNTFFKK